LDHQNKYVERLSTDDNAAKNFNVLAINLSVLHLFRPFLKQTFSDLVEFLDISAKPIFP